MVKPNLKGSAVLSDDGKHRYSLTRATGVIGGNHIVFVMVNPSTADATKNDATIRKVIGFSVRNYFSDITVVNIFSYRSKNVKDLAKLDLYTALGGTRNTTYIRNAFEKADMVVVAWGRLDKLPNRFRNEYKRIIHIANQTNTKLYCLKHLKDGHPAHPCMLGYKNKLQEWDYSKLT